MFNKNLITALSAALLLTACGGEPAETATQAPDTAAPATATPAAPTPVDASAAVAAVRTALGADNLNSITYSGTAWRIRNSFMQTPTASPPWESRDEITNYTRTIDLTDVNAPVSFAKGDTFASNLFLAPPVAGTYTQNIPADQKAWAQQLEIWLTPWGFVKGAEAYGATSLPGTLDGAAVTTITWQSPTTQVSPAGLQYTVTGYVNADNLIERVETKVDDPFMGDFQIINVYDNYQDLGGGLMVPTVIEQQRGGGGVFGVSVTSASANPANLAELLTPPAPPAAPPGGGAPPAAPPAEIAQQLAEGVYLITAGYQALALEFADHVVVVEAGQSEARGQQILDETKRLFPDKPIRYLVNSHPHSDHTAGMVPFVREGVTIVTHANNVDFLNMALSTPRTLLGQPTLEPQFEAAEGVKVMEDATRRLELHSVPNAHTDGMLVAYLPNERILFQADFTLPQNGAAPNPFVVGLAEYVDANMLDFDQYLAVHAAAVPQTKADLLATIGK